MTGTAARPDAAPAVLVIEDEPSVMAYIRASLERGGYRTIAAGTGAEALRLLAADGADFLGVISDMRTPGGISGADVHAWITVHRPDLASRLVFVTGDTVNEDTARVLRQTGAPCLEKPFRVQQLLAVVQRTFGRPQ